VGSWPSRWCPDLADLVTVGELAKWAVVRKWGQDRRVRLDAWTAGRPVIPYDTQIARVWGELAGAAQLRGRPAAERHLDRGVLLRFQVPLVTLNTADFNDFAARHGLVLLGEQG
jgi:toxin FitB